MRKLYYAGNTNLCNRISCRGFNVVLTALLNIAFVGGSYHLIKKSNSPLAVSKNMFIVAILCLCELLKTTFQVGFLIGVAGMMTVISLMTAIYWGQLSKCETVDKDISQYSCTQKVGYGAVSAFASLLFVVQGVFFGILIAWRSEIIDDGGGSYGDLRPFADSAYDAATHQHFNAHTHNPTTVDL